MQRLSPLLSQSHLTISSFMRTLGGGRTETFLSSPGRKSSSERHHPRLTFLCSLSVAFLHSASSPYSRVLRLWPLLLWTDCVLICNGGPGYISNFLDFLSWLGCMGFNGCAYAYVGRCEHSCCTDASHHPLTLLSCHGLAEWSHVCPSFSYTYRALTPKGGTLRVSRPPHRKPKERKAS